MQISAIKGVNFNVKNQNASFQGQKVNIGKIEDEPNASNPIKGAEIQSQNAAYEVQLQQKIDKTKEAAIEMEKRALETKEDAISLKNEAKKMIQDAEDMLANLPQRTENGDKLQYVYSKDIEVTARDKNGNETMKMQFLLDGTLTSIQINHPDGTKDEIRYRGSKDCYSYSKGLKDLRIDERDHIVTEPERVNFEKDYSIEYSKGSLYMSTDDVHDGSQVEKKYIENPATVVYMEKLEHFENSQNVGKMMIVDKSGPLTMYSENDSFGKPKIRAEKRITLDGDRVMTYSENNDINSKG